MINPYVQNINTSHIASVILSQQSFFHKKQMNKKIRILPVIYKLGALIDLYFVFALMFPMLWAFTFGLDDFKPDIYERFTMMTAASLMLGWTCLLLWADQKPIERRGVLILTVFPVISGFIAILCYALACGASTFGNIGFVFIKLIILSILFILSYLEAGNTIEKGR